MVHDVAPLLISTAAGYWVLTQAEREKGQFKKLGRLLGLIIIAVSLISGACKIYCLATGQGMTGWSAMCPISKACPFGSKSVPSN